MRTALRLQNLLNNIKNSFKRFPITIAVSTSLVIMLIILLEKGSTFTPEVRDIFNRVSMIIALGIPLSVCIKLIIEKKEINNRIHKILGYLIGAIILVLYYLLLLNDINWISIIRYIAVSLFLYLAFAYISWMGKKEGYEYYIIDVLSSFFVTVIYSFVLFIGIFIILFTIVQLFDVDLPYKLVFYTFLVIAGIFAPSLFLARIPGVNEEFNNKEYPKTLKVLLLYIVIPLITIYSTILYAYFLKIIITRDWPQGLVSHLVLWYSVVSVAAIFFITPLLNDNKLAKRFKSIFPKYIIPILIMMFVAMTIRINAYGITENRYFGLILGLWVSGIMICFTFKKNFKNTIIPISLSIIALISVFGPLSSFSISKYSQNNRLESILVKNEMLVDNEIIEKDNISQEDREEISMVLKYFNDNHSLNDVKYIPSDFKIKDMEMVFGFPYTEKNIYENNYFSYHSRPGEREVIDIKGYDYFIDSMRLMNKPAEIDGLKISYNNNTVTVKKDDEVLYEKDLSTYADELMAQYDNDADIKLNDILSLDDTTFVNENDKVKIKLIINSFSGRKDYGGENRIEYVECDILIKVK